jgi:hypothetical protein
MAIIKSSWPNMATYRRQRREVKASKLLDEPTRDGPILYSMLYLFVCTTPEGVNNTSKYRIAACVQPSESPNFELTHSVGTMDAQRFLPKVPSNVNFRVLIIGRANAGKTSILQRVCDTTESPEIYRPGPRGKRERVRSHS